RTKFIKRLKNKKMGLLSFIKGVGEKVFGHKETLEEKQQKVLDHLNKFGLLQPGVTVSVDENDKVTLSGQVDSREARQRIIATVANIEGVDAVDDQLVILIKNVDAAPVQETAAPEKQFYQVKSGDTLSKIAKEMYGDANKYPKIFEANKPMLSDPDKIYPGQTLVIPELA
ncbi:MAG TPA: peptidoglycan-binding protein LysM, partial [Chitinophagales bacterium]|nr:peptidoglycan-binding protein LysM [Chitinophagales bacterium]